MGNRYTDSKDTQLPIMTVHASRFTPEVLLSAPRRSTGVPNSTGDLVLYTVCSHCRPPSLPFALLRKSFTLDFGLSPADELTRI